MWPFLYALRREVVRNPTPLRGSLTSTFVGLLHARAIGASIRSWLSGLERRFRRQQPCTRDTMSIFRRRHLNGATQRHQP
jgi:hypothetical protein